MEDHHGSVYCIASLPPLTPVADPEEILEKNGVDPYVFVRFLIMMSKAMVPIWLISWIVLLPVDSANTGNTGKDGLDRLTYGNVPPNMQNRLWTHLIMDYLFIGMHPCSRLDRG